ncbi:uncharacterized protein LOC143447068 [Clavelina lepadiformis]|uniref:uncharacterized protein LOC143447068 n=1 Tax=Clavelina lepadiformis TaxID=159417 RepID=UPI0040429D21
MVRNYVRKTQRGKWSEENMKKAIDDVKNKKLSIRQAAEQHEVPKSTLERHWKGRVVHPGKVNLGKYEQALNSDLEEELVEHVKKMQEMFFGITGETLRALAFQLANANGIPVPFNINNRKAGKDWLLCFLKRHPDLSLQQPEPTSLSRATGFNRTQVGRFFDLLKATYEKEAITAENVYNVDETGITCVQKPEKIIVKKGIKQVGRITSAKWGKSVTAVCAMSAIGNYVPPIFIFPQKRMAMGLMQDAPPGSRGFASPSGWKDSNIFLEWLKHFKKYVNPSIDKKVLLILDNDVSHLTLPAIEFARQNGIIMLSIPPHTSHRLQPLVRTFFGPLKTYYHQAIDHWMITNYGKCVQSSQVCGFFCTAYSKAATVQKAVNGFKSAGIMPFNPDIFDETDFPPSMVTEIHAVDSPELEADGATTIQVKQEVVEETVPALSTTAQALRVKLENIAEVLDNYQVDSVPEYCIDDLQELDGASLLKLFTKYGLSNNGVSQYRCQISSHDCDRVYAGHDQKECREMMISHLLEHVKTYREKAAKYPHLYKKKRLKPCQPIIVRSEPDYSDYNDPVASQPLPSKQQNTFVSASLMNPIIARLTTEVSRSIIVPLSDTTDLPSIDILPDMETERLLSTPDPKEALMSAVSLKRNQTTSQSSLDDAKKKSINTRGSRKKIIQERNRILHQRRQERVRKHFSNQPRVLIRDAVKSRLPLEPKPVENPFPSRNYRPIRPKPADGSIPTPLTSNRYVEKKVPPRKRKKPATHLKQVKAKKAPSRPPPPPQSSEDSSSSEDDGSSEQGTTDTEEKTKGKYSFQLPRKKTLLSSLRNNRERRLRMMRVVQGPKIKKEKVAMAKINTQNSDSTIKTGDNSEILQVQPAKLEPSMEPSSNCLPSSLKDRKQFPPKRHLPSILRRNKPKPLLKNDNIASIQIKECMSLAREEIMSTKGGNDSSSEYEIVEVVSKSSPKQFRDYETFLYGVML